MKLTLTLAIAAFLCTVLSVGEGLAQTRINPKIGFETWIIQDEVSQGHSSHSGQTIGFDVFVGTNRFLFVPGFYYHRISIPNREEGLIFEIPKKNGAHYFSIPISVGMELLDFGILDASLLGGGEVTFFHSLDSNDISLDDDRLHGVFAGLTGGAQVEVFSILTLDIRYHHALHPMIKNRPDSNLRGWTLAAGIKF